MIKKFFQSLVKWLIDLTSAPQDPHRYLHDLLQKALLLHRRIEESSEEIKDIIPAYAPSLALSEKRKQLEECLREREKFELRKVCLEINKVMHAYQGCRTRDPAMDRYLMRHKYYDHRIVNSAYMAWSRHMLDHLLKLAPPANHRVTT